MVVINIEWRWEDMCGPDGLVPWDANIRDMGYCFQRLFILIPTLFLLAAVSSYYVGRRVDWVIRGRLQRVSIDVRLAAVFCLAVVPLVKIYGYLDMDTDIYGIDYFACGAEFIAWIVHFAFVLALRQRLGISPRGPVLVLVLWSVTAVLSITVLRMLIITHQPYGLAVFMLVLNVIYAFTLLPSEGVTSPTHPPDLFQSQYTEIERHPLLQRWINNNDSLGVAFEDSSLLSRLLFYWVNPLFYKGLQQKLSGPDDLFDLPISVTCNVVSSKMDKALIGNVDRYQNGMNESVRRTRGNYGSVNNESFNVDAIPNVQIVAPTRRYNISLLRALHSCFGIEFYSIGLLKLLADVSGFAGPLLLSRLINYIDDPSIDVKMGYIYAGGLLLSSLIGAFCDAHFNMRMVVVGLKLRAAIMSTVFKKMLSITSSELDKNFSVGEVTNFISTDTDRIVNSCPSFHAIWSIPLQLTITLYLLYVQVGVAFLAGVAFSIALIPINKYVANKIGSLSSDLMKYKDGRVSLMTEILKNIKTIKLYVWEDYFVQKVSDERANEIKYLKGRKYLDAICVFFWATTPVIVTTLTLSTYALLGNKLNAAIVFTTIALLNMLIAPLNAFPWVLNGVTEAWVSLKRIQSLLNMDDFIEHSFQRNDTQNTERDIVLSLKNASFKWATGISRVSKDGASEIGKSNSSLDATTSEALEENLGAPFQLTNISFDVYRGEFVGIIGKIGSGKTSLLNAILSELNKLEGSFWKCDNINGFGFVSQKPWLKRGTIRENIIFGKAYEESKYRTVIDACGLTEDLLLLGNNTQIGEGGSTLSGGQAARIALARAVYHDKQVYLLDDVLSAVDVKVGAHIYKKCIMGLLKYKTRILVTHSIQYVSQSDKIILMEHGKIKSYGPPAKILSEIEDHASMDRFDSSDCDVVHSNHQSEKSSVVDNLSLNGDTSNTSVANEEISATGQINFWVLTMYWKGIGTWLALAILSSLLVMQISRNSSDVWLSYWVNSMTQPNKTNLTAVNPFFETNPNDSSTGVNVEADLYLGKLEMSMISSADDGSNSVSYFLSIYAGFAVLNSVLTLLRAFLFAYGGICAAVNIHKKLLDTMIKAKTVLFDVTPVGLLLNRFSSDTYTIDDSLPFILNIFLAQMFGVIGSIFVTAYGLPWVSLIIVPLMPIYHWLQHRYRITSRDLKRLGSVTLTPIYSYFNDTLEGATIIRAFGRCHQWFQNGEHYVERSQKTTLNGAAAAQWLSLRLQLMGSALLTGGAMIAVMQRNFDVINAGFVGLAISYALSITSLLSGVINSFTETEREMIAVERVGEYINIAENIEENFGTYCNPPPYGWPTLGMISFQNVVLKYRRFLPPSLKNISIEINPGEKIGVVGRTGAGKSSLFAALFRLIDLDSGVITIDSVDIRRITLSALRSRLAIIPQEPFIFKGSIRKNLDPFEQHTDVELWSALEKCGAKQIIHSKGGLHISASDFSRGHMQLLCLTRAVLQNSKILCIDEATANIDQETDRLIQKTIRCVFRKSTVITIAHRISTILDSDTIIVMQEGEVIEMDKPERLLEDPNSHFYHLVNQDNLNN